MVEAAAWNRHLQRNQSVVAELCHGMLQSKLTCARPAAGGDHCARTSPSDFTPFNVFSVVIPERSTGATEGAQMPMPMKDCVQVDVVLVRKNESSRAAGEATNEPTLYRVSLNKDAKIGDLKREIALMVRTSSLFVQPR